MDHSERRFGTPSGSGKRADSALLSIRDVRCGYGKKEVVHGVSFDVGRGEFACIIGANGCGKTTLLKNVLCLDRPFGGEVLLDGRNVMDMSEQQRARRFAYLPQAHTPPFPFSVADVVLMGRSPYLDRFSRIDDEDRRIAWEALCQLGIEGLADETYTELSGGQRQLILVARCLAQEPNLIVMDEPTASLDFGNQQIVLSRMRDLTRSGMSVLMVTHDPHQAFYCADTVVVMQSGQVIAQGDPSEVMTRAMLERVYHTPLNVIEVEREDGVRTKVCVPL